MNRSILGFRPIALAMWLAVLSLVFGPFLRTPVFAAEADLGDEAAADVLIKLQDEEGDDDAADPDDVQDLEDVEDAEDDDGAEDDADVAEVDEETDAEEGDDDTGDDEEDDIRRMAGGPVEDLRSRAGRR